MHFARKLGAAAGRNRFTSKNGTSARNRTRHAEPPIFDLQPLESRLFLSATASFVSTDATTRGNWSGRYGADGYSIFNSGTSLPAYANVSSVNSLTSTWSASTTDTRALQAGPSSLSRIAAQDYSPSGYSFNVNLTDTGTHQVAVYVLDWDNTNRAETVQLTDAVSGSVLDTRTASNFHEGQYLTWNISGSVNITLTRIAGENATSSGVFFDPARVPTYSGLSVTATTALSVSLQWNAVVGAASYFVLRKDPTSQSYFAIGSLQNTNFNDVGVSAGRSYSYEVFAAGGDGSSTLLGPISADTPSDNSSIGALAIAPTTANALKLSWTTNASNASAVEIDRSTDDSHFGMLTLLGGNATTYFDSGLAEATRYWYRVEALTPAGTTGSVEATTCTLADAPDALVGNATSTSTVSLTWVNHSAGSTGARIDRSTDGQNYSPIASLPGDATAYTDTDAGSSAQFWYEVLAIDSSGVTASSPINVTMPASSDSGPTFLTATAESTSEIGLAWNNNSPNATQFEIDRSTDGVNYSPLPGGDTTNQTFQDTSVIAGTNYWYLVRAIEPDGSSLASAPTSCAASPNAPAALTAVPVSPTEIDLSWVNASPDATGIIVNRSTDGSNYSPIDLWPLDPTSTSYADQTAAEDTHYWYSVSAVEPDGSTPVGPPVDAWTSVIAPSGLTAVPASANAIVLSWTNNSAASPSFKVQRANGTGFQTIGMTARGVTSFIDHDVFADDAYTYRVVAVGHDSDSTPSDAFTANTFPQTPTDLAVTGTTPYSISLAWTAALGDTSYELLREGPGQTSFSPYCNTALTTFVDTGLQQNRAYSYEVIGTDGSTFSMSVGPVSATTSTTGPIAPSNLVATNSSATEVDLNWTASIGSLTGYDVERSTDGTHFSVLSATDVVNQFADTSVQPGSQFIYRVRAANGGLVSGYSNSLAVLTAPAAPANVSVTTVTPASVTLGWSASAGAANYSILRKGTTDASFVTIGTCTATTFTDSSTTDNASYYYEVIATDAGGNSTAGGPIFVTTSPITASAPTSLLATVNPPAQVLLSWTAPGGPLTAYHLERSIDGVSFTEIAGNLSISSYVDETASAGGNYYYRVRAENAGTFSAYSNAFQVTLAPPMVSGLALAASNATSLALAWQPAAGATSYNVKREGPGETAFSSIGTSNTASFFDNAVQPSTSYLYEIVAGNSGGIAPVGNPLSVSTRPSPPSAPAGLTSSANSSTSITLSWTAAAGIVTAYHVERSTDGTTFSEIAGDLQATSYTDASAHPNTSYTYRVRAEDDGSLSAYSGTSQVTSLAATAPVEPANLAAIGSASGIALQWSANTEADLAGYNVFRGTSASGPFAQLNGILLPAPAYNDAAAPQGVTEYYQVVAVDSSNLVSAAATVSATRLNTIAVTPSTLTASQVTANGVLLTWAGQSDATFNVYRNGQQVASGITGTAYLDASVAPSTGYSYTVAAIDGSGAVSAQSATLPVNTPAPTSGTLLGAPSAPTSLTASAMSGGIRLNWVNANSNSVTYSVQRNGAQIGSATSASFFDTSVRPGATYTYSVIAYDANYDASPPAAVSGTAGADQTAPNAPTDLTVTASLSNSISLSWVQPWDDVGVTGYKIYRDSTLLTTQSSTAGTNFIDRSVIQPATSYAYTVTAIDAAGNESAAAYLSATTTGNANVDESPDQYIPKSYQDYFYNTLTTSLRQKIEAVPLNGSPVPIPSAARWLDLPITYPQSLGDPIITNAPTLAYNLEFHDLNGNGQWDPGEPAWVSANGGCFQTGDAVISGSPVVGTPGVGGIYIIDKNGNHKYDGTDALVPQPQLIEGQQGAYAYRDLAGSGTWSAGDPVWLDVQHNSMYETGDPVVYNPYNIVLKAGDWGKTNGINYYDVGGDTNNRIIWSDSTSFRQDLSDFYNAVDQLAPHFSGGTYPNDILSAGAMLKSAGAKVFTGTGTISIDTSNGPTSEVDGIGTHFTTEIVPGDNIQIGGNWYPVAGVGGDTELLLAQNSNSPAYSGPSISHATVSLINWTLIPAASDPGTGLSFTYQRGLPSQTSPVFPQQFQQLHDALSQLTTYPNRYGEWLFDSETSGRFINTATDAINISRSLFGDPSNTLGSSRPGAGAQLEVDVASGDADPGSVFSEQLLEDLRGAVQAIENVVYVRDPSAASTNGWVTKPDSHGNPQPIVFAQETSTLLPATSTTLSQRVAGSWSGNLQGDGLNRGSPIDPLHINEIQGVIDAIKHNGLWVENGQPTFWGTLDEQVQDHLFGYRPSPYDFPSIGSIGEMGDQVIKPAGQSWTSLLGEFELTYGTDDAGITSDYFADYVGATFLAILPTPTNPLGGSQLGSLEPGPGIFDVDVSGWEFGRNAVIGSYSTSTILGVLSKHYPADLPPMPPFPLTNQLQTTPFAPAGPPHLFFTEDAYATLDTEGFNFPTFAQDIAVVFGAQLPNSLFGLVPLGGSFSHTPTGSTPQPAAIPQPPKDPLPLTTQMDLQNVMPDSYIDGIVHVPADVQTFGADTGAIAFQADRDTAQTYLPLYTDNSGALPVNAYITQGAFGDSQTSVGGLTSTAWTFPDENQDGVPFAYSLDTRVRINLLVDQGQNHVKRIEVIRPGGNAVVFDFAWDAGKGMFSPYGTPDGWKGRDSHATYVLRALDPTDDTSLNYQLEFSSGIVQTFNGGITAVSDTSTGLIQSVYGALPWGLGSGAQVQDVGDKYNLTLNWSAGDISSLDYQTVIPTGSIAQPQTIHTALAFNANTVTGVQKSTGGSNIPEFSYAVSGNTITHNGITIQRSGTVAGGSVTFTTTLPGNASFAAGSSTSEVLTFNSDRLVTDDALTLNEGSGNPTTATTSYEYQDGSDRYDNGAPKSSKVTKVTHPDGSWVGYTYDDKAGWVTRRITPFMSSNWSPSNGGGGDTSGDRVERYVYQPAAPSQVQPGDEFTGDAADPNNLVERPREVIDSVEGIQTAETFNRYGSNDGTDTVVSRQALTNSNPTWATAGLFSTTQIAAFDASSTKSVLGDTSTIKYGSNSSLSYQTASDWFGSTRSQSTTTLNAFGHVTQSSGGAVGTPYGSDTSNTQDAFGRSTKDTLASGLTVISNYQSNDWFGPSSVIEADGSTTEYTYTPLGQVASEIDYAYGVRPVEYQYEYDAVGNVVSATQSPASSSGPTGPGVTNTYAFDAQGRLTKEVDNSGGNDATANRTTTTVYASDGTYNTATTTNPDGSTLITKDYLDGSPASDGGTGQTPTTYLEGVAGSTPDPTEHGSADAKITPGSTWTEVSTDGTANWTRTYTNVLGEAYLTQQSSPTSSAALGSGGVGYADSMTKFDGNLRPIESIGFDNSKSFNVYNPVTGLLAATWTAMDGRDTYNAASDSKTIYAPTPVSTSASSPGGSDTKVLSNSGTLDSNSTTSNGGLNSSDTTNGLTTSTTTVVDGNGIYHTVTTNPDGTKEKDTYTDGLLTDQVQLDKAGNPIADISYHYNPNRTLASSTDYTGVTTYTYFQDGTEQSVTRPGHAAQTVTALNTNTEAATSVHNADGTTTSQAPNPLGQTTSQSGAGVIAAGFGYDKQGRLTSLTTYSSGEVGNINDPNAAATQWKYDSATGQLQSKIYADGSYTDYRYNAAGQLKGVTGPDLTGNNFVYNAAGQLTGGSYTDAQTGLVRSKLTVDDQGRPSVATSTDNGKTFSNVTTYTALGQPQNETFGSAGGVIVARGYFPVIPGAQDPSPTTESPDALKSLTIQSLPNGQANAATTYGYDPVTKRLKTITVNGVTFTIAYLDHSNQIASITAGTVTTTFTPDGFDAARLYQITTNANGSDVYQATLGYNQLDQINSQSVQQENGTNDGSSYNSYTYVYDPNQANALTQVKDSAGNVLYSYSYDGVGNHTGTSLGTANDLNQYSALSYNARGDVTNDGTYAYTYDANDRMISVTPHDTTQPKLAYGYDSQGRRLWKDVYTWDAQGGAWTLSYSRHYVYDGTNLVGELDGNNRLVTGYTWGANVQLLAVTDYTQATPKSYVAVIDPSGNTALLIDPTAGTVAASYTYDPFGNLLAATGPRAGHLLDPGQRPLLRR